MERHQSLYVTYGNYAQCIAMKEICLVSKIEFLQSIGAIEEANLLIEEYKHYKKTVIEPFIYEVVGIFAHVSGDGIE